MVEFMFILWMGMCGILADRWYRPFFIVALVINLLFFVIASVLLLPIQYTSDKRVDLPIILIPNSGI